jgi:membrane protein required for colicin V production
MTVFDLIVLLMTGASVMAGLLRGIVRALLTGVALIVGLIVASRSYGITGALLRGLGVVESNAAANAGGFLLLMLLALIIGFIAGRLVTKGLRRAHVEWFDRLLGGAFGAVRGFALCSALYMALTAFPVHLASVTDALTAPLLASGAEALGVLTSTEMQTRFLNEYRAIMDSK